MKKCRGCEKRLPVGSFHRDKTTADGLSRRCKACRKTYYVPKQQVVAIAGAKKRCSACRELKEVTTGYYRTRRSSDGFYAQCKRCHTAAVTRWAARNGDSVATYQTKWRRKNPEKARHRRRIAQLKKRGLTLPQYEAMAAENGGKCWICKDTPPRLVVDHCHATGKTRGLLCSNCNTGLGLFKDSPDVLAAAVRYLTR